MKEPNNSQTLAAKVGLPPGSLVHVGKRKVEQPRLFMVRYNESFLQEKEDISIQEMAVPGKEEVGWIHLAGVHDSQVMAAFGEAFGLHPLTLEDIMHTNQRPKAEEMGNYLFFVLRQLDFDEESGELSSEQVAVVLGENYVLSFEEDISPAFNPVRKRLRREKGRLRQSGADYLAYALIDAAVDHYFLALEKLGEKIEALEEELISNPQRETLHEIHRLKNATLLLRRSVWPLREAISWLSRSGSSLIKESTQVFLRDVYDHTIQVIDTIETFRDMLSGMLDTYLSSLSNRMNEIMKLLTIIATVFIPLTFIAGIYGMNFDFMPELKWRWGYFACLGVMAGCALWMIFYFRRKRWL